jgi:hypothetical protein
MDLKETIIAFSSSNILEIDKQTKHISVYRLPYSHHTRHFPTTTVA